MLKIVEAFRLFTQLNQLVSTTSYWVGFKIQSQCYLNQLHPEYLDHEQAAFKAFFSVMLGLGFRWARLFYIPSFEFYKLIFDNEF